MEGNGGLTIVMSVLGDTGRVEFGNSENSV